MRVRVRVRVRVGTVRGRGKVRVRGGSSGRSRCAWGAPKAPGGGLWYFAARERNAPAAKA